MVVVVGIDDLRQRRPAERRNAKQPGAESRALLAFEFGRILVPEHEGAWHRPFARLSGLLKDESVRRIEADGTQQFHRRGPPRLASYQDGEIGRASWRERG